MQSSRIWSIALVQNYLLPSFSSPSGQFSWSSAHNYTASFAEKHSRCNFSLRCACSTSCDLLYLHSVFVIPIFWQGLVCSYFFFLFFPCSAHRSRIDRIPNRFNYIFDERCSRQWRDAEVSLIIFIVTPFAVFDTSRRCLFLLRFHWFFRGSVLYYFFIGFSEWSYSLL